MRNILQTFPRERANTKNRLASVNCDTARLKFSFDRSHFPSSLDGRSCKDEIYRMGIGAAYSEGNLNFATASEDDEVYTKKKVSRVSHELVLCTIGSIISAFVPIAAERVE